MAEIVKQVRVTRTELGEAPDLYRFYTEEKGIPIGRPDVAIEMRVIDDETFEYAWKEEHP